MRVGICWTGSKAHRNDAMRSLPRGVVGPLTQVQGVRWLCMAKDDWTPALADLGLENPLAFCADWYDTAKVVRSLDLLISVDTAIAHLAGGLGIPTWLLIAAVPDMRWMLERTDTPWYQSVTLYRQQKAGDWGLVVERVRNDLRAEVERRKVAA